MGKSSPEKAKERELVKNTMELYKVDPIVIYPNCILTSGHQGNCFKCDNRDKCLSPRSMCTRPYKGHPKGCPNYGKKSYCPPNMQCMYDEIFDMSDVYAVATPFNLKEFIDERRMKRPDLPEGQLSNKNVWQPITEKENDWAVSMICQNNSNLSNYVSTRYLECMGVDVVNTMKNAGLELKFPIGDIVYRISFLSKAKQDTLERLGFYIKREKSKDKKGLLTLRIKD